MPEDYPLVVTGYRIDESGRKYIRVIGVRLFTNLDFVEMHKELIPYKKYIPEEYPNYDNYYAINLNVTKDIPFDYAGAMGLPITFLDKYNTEQFEIVGLANDKRTIDDAFVQVNEVYLDDQNKKFVGIVLKENNKLRNTYARVFIRNKRLGGEGEGK